MARLCGLDGKILLLGATFSNITLLHHAEQLANLPDKHIDRYQMPVLQSGQRAWVAIEEYDTTDGIADFGCPDYFLEIGRAYHRAGKGQANQIGSAAAYLFAADDLKHFGIAWLEAHYQGPRQAI